MSGQRRLRRQVARTSVVAAIACGLIAAAPASAFDASRDHASSEGGKAMRKYGAVLALLAVLGTASTASWATPPGKNGQIAFRRYLDPGRTTGAIFTANPDGSGVKQVTRPARGVIDQYPDLSPNGKTIVFHRMVPCPAGGAKDGMDGTCDLVYTVGRDGSGLRPLVPCDFDAQAALPCVGVHTPAWSRDGSKIAFSYSLVREAYDASLDLNRAIWIVDTNGTDARQVTELSPPGGYWDDEPQFSPDGSRLVFTRVDLQRKADAVFVVNVDGSSLRQLTPWSSNAAGDPEWSPDGQWIILVTHPPDGSENVSKVRPNGTGLVNLTKQKASGFHYLSSSFSPDGKQIVSARTPGAGPNGHADLVVMRANGSGARPITNTALWESSVDWGSHG
jgi:Tol biopolymer transport system component